MTANWLLRVGTGGGRRAAAVALRPRLRLIALPHAGGWPSAFRSWRQVLPEDVEFLVGQLPGRGPRTEEPAARRVEPLVEGLSRAVAELEPLPYAILGHSFGSVLGYELAKAMEQKGLPPRLLAVSARQPPCFPSEPPFAHLRTDAELLAHLVEMGGISRELISRTDLVRPALRAIRADLEAMETYRRPLTGTSVPILSLGAVDDPVVVAERLHLWSLETTGTFTRRMFTGGHFYLYAPGAAAAVARQLIAGLDGPSGDGSTDVPPHRPAALARQAGRSVNPSPT
ncbi:thioesterase II family protein [Streptomyces sp. NPDC059479]|uniref:thioesterase II family protein n=1 Tax=Streptomyces sp. NPDC059479 TaxID=3346848 RepID=UPI00367B4821